MNRTQMVAPFAEEELRTFKGRGGKTMTFIEDETVMDRLDAGYGFGNWQILVDPVPTDAGVVKVRLGVRDQGEWTWYEDFGYPNQPDGDVLKEAVSDGIRRCGRYVGIARDLYRKSTYEPGGSLGPKAAPEAATNGQRPAPQNTTPPGPAHNPDGSLIGTAEIGTGTADYELRQGPRGGVLSFRLRSGRQTFKVVAEGVLADALYAFREDVIGQTVTAWGRIGTEKWTPPNAKKAIEYQVLALERISTAAFDLPGPVEAPTEPLGLENDPELDAIMANVPVPG